MAIESKTRLLESDEAAAFLELSADTIRQYIRRKLIKPAYTVGGAYLIEESECKRFSKARRKPGRPAKTA